MEELGSAVFTALHRWRLDLKRSELVAVAANLPVQAGHRFVAQGGLQLRCHDSQDTAWVQGRERLTCLGVALDSRGSTQA
eukprot:3276050-Lingulodinium_polyedra.AAC.1